MQRGVIMEESHKEEISHKNSYDILKAYQEDYESIANNKAKAALEVKSAIDTTKNTRRLIIATWVLAVFTALLFISTVIYTRITYNAYQNSKEQYGASEKQFETSKKQIDEHIDALNALTKSVRNYDLYQRTKDIKPLKNRSNKK